MTSVICWKHTNLTGLEKLDLEPGNEPQTLDQASFLIPAGAYTTFRTYQKAFGLHFSNHLTRLEETARISNHSIDLNKPGLRSALRSALAETPWLECRVRITIDLESEGQISYIFLEELHIPTQEQYQNGVAVTTIRTRRENPKAKLSTFIPLATYYRDQAREKAYEILMASEDREILEGTSSNFFAVHDGILRTAGSGVLEGITRTFVLEIAKKLKIPVAFDAVRVDEIVGLSEAFITSSSRGILPVVRIDDTLIGSGKPGEITGKLRREFDVRVADNLEKI
jgi:branched-chain amino acid aminotransferase